MPIFKNESSKILEMPNEDEDIILWVKNHIINEYGEGEPSVKEAQ